MHKVVMINPSATETRIVNSVMLAAGDPQAEEQVGAGEQATFVATTEISAKVGG